MKGKKYSTEDKIRILRQADGGRSILEVCREANISEVTFHRWRNQFGQMEVSEAKRLKELERENTELKKMLAESLLKNRVPEGGVRKKVISPEQRRRAAGGGGQRAVFRAGGVPVFEGVEAHRTGIGAKSQPARSRGCSSGSGSSARSMAVTGIGESPPCCGQEGWPVDVLWVSTGFFVGVIDMAGCSLSVLDFQSTQEPCLSWLRAWSSAS